MKTLLIFLVQFYRAALSPLKPNCCRFVPTCSEYALDAVNHYGALRGSWLSIRRILRCHPFHSGGYDPLPLHSCHSSSCPSSTSQEHP